MAQYANLQALQHLLPARVSVNTASARTATGTTTTQLTITNTSKGSSVAFFLRADIVRGSGNAPVQGDSDVLPVTWSSNDVTLWPGETEKLTATYRTSELKGLQPVVAISGWNVKSFSIAVR
jgi:exo-1,4-beta-D-glucosaminidase